MNIYILIGLYCTAEVSYSLTGSEGLNTFLTETHFRLAKGVSRTLSPYSTTYELSHRLEFPTTEVH
jgi:hypothetical protein